jgi:hypothetical protein
VRGTGAIIIDDFDLDVVVGDAEIQKVAEGVEEARERG